MGSLTLCQDNGLPNGQPVGVFLDCKGIIQLLYYTCLGNDPRHPALLQRRASLRETVEEVKELAQYELMYILRPDLGEEDQLAATAKVQQTIEASGGTVQKTDKWGRRKLAYEINDYAEGLYVVVNFQGDGTIANEITRLLNINEDVVRSIVVREDE